MVCVHMNMHKVKRLRFDASIDLCEEEYDIDRAIANILDCDKMSKILTQL